MGSIRNLNEKAHYLKLHIHIFNSQPFIRVSNENESSFAKFQADVHKQHFF